MSFRISSSRSGRRPDRLQIVALLGCQRCAERELGHADDAVHRRPDLVTHVGQELALGPARFHRLVTCDRQVGVDGRKLRGPGFDGALQPFLVLDELDVAAMNLREHLVEAVDELGDLVLALAFTLDSHVVHPVIGSPRGSPT